MALIDTYRTNVAKKREQISKLFSEKAKENEKKQLQQELKLNVPAML